MIDASWIALNLPGVIGLSLVLGAIVAYVASRLLVSRYLAAVAKAMRSESRTVIDLQVGRDIAGAYPSPPTAESSITLQRRLARGPWESGFVLGFGGLAFSLVAAAGYAWEAGGFPITRMAALLVVSSWITYLLTMLAAGATRRRKQIGFTVYLLLAVMISAYVLSRNPEASANSILLLWLLFNGLPSLLVALILARRVRAAGPLVMVVTFAGLLGASVVPLLATLHDGLLRAYVSLGVSLGLSSGWMLGGLLLLGFSGAALIGALVLRRIRSAYERKTLSDLTLAADAIVMPFAGVLLASFSSGQLLRGLWGVAAFAACKITTVAGFALLSHQRARHPVGRRLLLLRVFASGDRQEALLRSLATHWLHVGSIQLIGAPDVAAVTLEPHEVMDFVLGRLERRFIGSAEALRAQVAQLDLARDADGRFRVNEFFCNDSAWRATFLALAHGSDAVLMDLRAFTPAREGCIFEIATLLGVVPLHRVVFLTDETTDRPFLDRTLQRLTAELDSSSPNAGKNAQGSILAVHGQSGVLLGTLLRRLSVAAGAQESSPVSRRTS
ncbi:MAG: hypothetical protein ACT4P7_19630 [Gemmatimonadaceae bacterium]